MYCLVCPMQPCGHMLGKGLPLFSLECDVSLCYIHFPILCLRLGVVFVALIPDIYLLYSREEGKIRNQYNQVPYLTQTQHGK